MPGAASTPSEPGDAGRSGTTAGRVPTFLRHSHLMTTSLLRLPLAALIVCFTAVAARAQEPAPPLDEEGRIVQFSRDIAPLFAAHCLECHNERDAKNDFRIDDPESVAGYIEPGDGENSSLMIDFLTSYDVDMLMPPVSHGGPLSPAELALIRLWIDEGAHWPEDAVVGQAATVATEPAEPAVASNGRSLPERLWIFQGYFHPAIVHFPIALLLVGGLFVLISWKFPAVGDQVGVICLYLGTASSIVASAMGWAFAEQRGYGSWARVDTSAEIFWHRWSAIVVTVVAIGVSAVAIAAARKDRPGLHLLWKLGLLLLAAMVGLVGHQGGVLTYGKSHYEQAFEILRGEPAASPVPHGVEPAPVDEPADAVGQPGSGSDG